MNPSYENVVFGISGKGYIIIKIDAGRTFAFISGLQIKGPKISKYVYINSLFPNTRTCTFFFACH